MTTVVTLDVFSGLPNPSLQLSDVDERELHDRLAVATTMTHERPSGVVGGLGYRGFLISSHDPTMTAAGTLRVHEGLVDRGISLANVVDNTEIERFLLGKFKPRLGQDVHDHVHAGIASVTQFGAAAAPAACPQCDAADAPVYNPAPWNNPTVQPHNNCYNYANDQITNTFAQPGRAHGQQATVMDCAHVQAGAVADGLAVAAHGFGGPLAPGQGWYVALVIWPGADYHWYRQDKNGCWSHKPGQTAARNVDNAGHTISDPNRCNRGPYTIFCDYMVTKRGLSIA
ncbi:hypothetical protein G8O24_16225 [Bradyrhizobium sp. INPA01-394B]|uniref:C-type lectin domain-containing protein n=1 Tax=Bradyrhizobium campsiandrae TaxID=1729892 RepID=A0ABR7UBP2_9BRAD|nr:hypothetical protein [Bradyrhizobium campsiandrae]MBC9878887.1 hypothetical protein [Bradyrhizobium campsiandrae]MBC9980852.1 hypothetical protein [Bradyrhizobium campsiandrae]